MVNPQIVDYYASQIKSGASREEIKNALVGAGWSAADVEDSIKSKETVAPPSAKPAQAPSISMSDLIPASSQVSTVSTIPNVASASRMPAATARSSKAEKKPFVMPKIPVLPIVIGVVALAGFGLAGYFYMQNGAIQDKLTAATNAGNSANSTASGLNAQVASLTKSKDDLTAQVTALTAANASLSGDLSFFAIPASSTVSATSSVRVDFKGIVGGGGRSPYFLTDTQGVKVSVANSKDAKVDGALKPLVGQEAEISGTHTLGSNLVTVTAVNGTSL